MTDANDHYYESFTRTMFAGCTNKALTSLADSQVSERGENGDTLDLRLGTALALKCLAHKIKYEECSISDYDLALIYSREILNNPAISYERIQQIVVIMAPVFSHHTLLVSDTYNT
ncbi:MAG: hypothetical protein OCC49_14060 [Fibrobacterales bacterium]